MIAHSICRKTENICDLLSFLIDVNNYDVQHNFKNTFITIIHKLAEKECHFLFLFFLSTLVTKFE